MSNRALSSERFLFGISIKFCFFASMHMTELSYTLLCRYFRRFYTQIRVERNSLMCFILILFGNFRRIVRWSNFWMLSWVYKCRIYMISMFTDQVLWFCNNLSLRKRVSFVGYKPNICNSWIFIDFIVHVTAFGGSVYGSKY